MGAHLLVTVKYLKDEKWITVKEDIDFLATSSLREFIRDESDGDVLSTWGGVTTSYLSRFENYLQMLDKKVHRLDEETNDLRLNIHSLVGAVKYMLSEESVWQDPELVKLEFKIEH